MIQILYTQDHAARGLALSQAIPGSQHGLANTVASAKVGLDTLVFWGHGTFASLCDLSKDQIVTCVKSWKSANAGLATVEIITCNARHAPGGHDAFASQVKAGLRAGFLSSTRDVKVKALPVNVAGALNGFSILLAHAPNKSWCYVTAGGQDDRIMMAGSNLVRNESRNLAYDLAAAANNVASEQPARQYTLNSGYFNTLRASLVK